MRKFLRRFFTGTGIAAVVGLLLTLIDCGCASRRLEVRLPLAEPFDAIIVPGCPSKADGSLTECQTRRATWAAMLWERGHAQNFITSGSAVYTPYVEAEALAAAMTSLGVPAERIYLDGEALHTDENIYNALRIAKQLGWSRLAVASDRGQAVGGCQMLEDWHPQCGAFSMDYAAVKARMAASPQLQRIRTRQVTELVPLKQRERLRAQAAGRWRRPPSAILYPLMILRKGLGRAPWQPFAPEKVAIQTWASRVK